MECWLQQLPLKGPSVLRTAAVSLAFCLALSGPAPAFAAGPDAASHGGGKPSSQDPSPQGSGNSAAKPDRGNAPHAGSSPSTPHPSQQSAAQPAASPSAPAAGVAHGNSHKPAAAPAAAAPQRHSRPAAGTKRHESAAASAHKQGASTAARPTRPVHSGRPGPASQSHRPAVRPATTRPSFSQSNARPQSAAPAKRPSSSSAAAVRKPATPKVTICHGTSSTKNPYVTITIASAGWVNGHGNHADDSGTPAGAATCTSAANAASSASANPQPDLSAASDNVPSPSGPAAVAGAATAPTRGAGASTRARADGTSAGPRDLALGRVAAAGDSPRMLPFTGMALLVLLVIGGTSTAAGLLLRHNVRSARPTLPTAPAGVPRA